MTNLNGALPDYLLIFDDTGKAHLTDRHGALLLEKVTNPDTLIALLDQARANFRIIDPNLYLGIKQQKGNT